MQAPTEVITSRQNPLVSLTASLTERKYRTKEKLFRFDGKKLFLEALDAELPLVAVLFRASSAAALTQAAGERTLPRDCRAVILPDALFDRISEENAPQGVICVSKQLSDLHVSLSSQQALETALKPGRTLVLESVRDPGNLGTILRSAAAFGVANLCLSSDCADLYNPRTIRAAMGTLFRRKVLILADLPAAIEVLRSRGRVFAAALQSEALRLSDVIFGANDTVLIGNEGHGLSADTLAAADAALYIPMQTGVESLNAGIAASLVLWEFYRGCGNGGT